MSQREDNLTAAHDKLASLLLKKIQDETITAVEMRVAYDLIRYNNIGGGDVDRPNNPVTDLSENLPFSSIDEELPSRQYI